MTGDNDTWSALSPADAGGAPQNDAQPQPEPAPPDVPVQPDAPADQRTELRNKLAEAFTRWLDTAMDDEAQLEGIAPMILSAEGGDGTASASRDCDLYSLFSALTALKGEVGIQGRTFRQLTDAVAPMASRLTEMQSTQRAMVEAMADMSHRVDMMKVEQTAAADAREAVEALLDVHERMERGLQSFEQSVLSLSRRSKPWYRRLFGRSEKLDVHDALEAMREGYSLTLSRIQAALHQWGIERIGEAGEPFDPETMTAIEIEDTNKENDGVVMEVYRGGWRSRGRILATAQVKVGRFRQEQAGAEPTTDERNEDA